MKNSPTQRRWLGSLGMCLAVSFFGLTNASAGKEKVQTAPFRFHAPEGFIDAKSSHGQQLEPMWRVFCGGEGSAACAFSSEFEDDGGRAFAYVKLVPGAQPMAESLLAKLDRTLESAFDVRDAVVTVDERSLDAIDGHAAGRLLATVRASGHTTKRWVWIVATADSMAMITYVASSSGFENWRAAFEKSARATEGTVDAPPLLQQAFSKRKGGGFIVGSLWIIVAMLVFKVVAVALARRKQ